MSQQWRTALLHQSLFAAIPQVVGGAAAVLLLAGLWTPLAGVLFGIIEVSIAFSGYPPQSDDPWSRIMLAGIGVSVAMLGPGAWSVDARIFGRKHIRLR